MVADPDNGGPNEDEYLPEVNPDDSEAGSEYTPETNILHQDFEPEVSEVSPEGPSLFKKVMTVLGLVFIAIIVSMYLTYRQKSSEASQTETPKTTNAAVAKPDDLASKLGMKTEQKPAKPAEAVPKTAAVQKAAEPTPKPAPAPAPVAPKPASTAASSAEEVPLLASEISKGVSPPRMSVSPLAAAISESASPAGTTQVAMPEKKEEPKAVSTATAESTPAPMSSQSVETRASVLSPEIKESMAQVDTLIEQSKTNQTKIEDLATRLNGLDQSIVALNKSVDIVVKKLSALEAKPLSKPTVTPMAIPEQSAAMMPAEQHTPYVVRAIVPGRAWIERPMAGVITVMEGDQVPGYSKVAKIDDESGEVTLESGEVIQYGLDDH